MSFENVRDWKGTAEGLTSELKSQIDRLELAIDPPALRTVRLWRSKQLFAQPKGAEFGSRQILEGLQTALLLKKGWTLAAIAQVLPSFSDTALEQQILAEAEGKDPAQLPSIDTLLSTPRHRNQNDAAEVATILLAQGILRQYNNVLNREIVRQDDTIPVELYKAMCKLGRIYIEQGMTDRAACVHSVLEKSRHKLDSEAWDLSVFRQPEFRFGSVVLIDPELRVPTADCDEIARLSGSFGEDNAIEYKLYERLQDATEKMGVRRQHQAYTALRELMGRWSLISEPALWDYLEERDLTPLQKMVIETFFDRVPDIWLVDGLAHRCAHCGSLIRSQVNRDRFPDGRCPIRQCDGFFDPKVGEKIDPAQGDLLIAKPQILTYWTGPAIDELAIFDAARNLGLNAELYPDSDLCDISIDDRQIGIDVKSYFSPVSLALRLNRSIGGLIHYRRRILAISDRSIEFNPGYLSTLRSVLDKKGDPATLQIVPVSEVIKLLQEKHHAN
jgi:hypothetical protein